MADTKRTTLYDFHRSQNAKMVPFAGYEMPVQYPLGVMKEHIHTRSDAGLFDVSHMGQIILLPKSGNIADAASALETLIPVNILGLAENRQRYGFFTNDQGGIMDDLMIANRGDHLFLVVNAACKKIDIAHLQTNLSDSCDIDVISDRALIALQGPASQTVLETLCPAVADMRFMDVLTSEILGETAWISRSGYTGEDGYEISVPNSIVVELVTELVEMKAVEPIGLGARDSLRLEAGLCLYGNDIHATTTPAQAGLNWAIQKSRRLGGERAGGFPGADIILTEFEKGTARNRVGLRPDGRAPMREGTELFATDTGGNPIGSITSGGFGPTVGHPVSMGYVTTEFSAVDTRIYAEIRGKRMAAHVCALPFTPANFKR